MSLTYDTDGDQKVVSFVLLGCGVHSKSVKCENSRIYYHDYGKYLPTVLGSFETPEQSLCVIVLGSVSIIDPFWDNHWGLRWHQIEKFITILQFVAMH